MRIFPKNLPDGVTDKMFDEYERKYIFNDENDEDEDDFDPSMIDDDSLTDDEILNWTN